MATSSPPALAIAVWVLTVSAVVPAQQLLNWAADDGKRVAALTKDGGRIDGQNVIIWFPPTLSRADAELLLKRIDPAVAGLWRRVGTHDWQLVPKGKITYYVVDDAFVAHASGRSAVFVPMARVRDGRAPFLHEATHELLASRRNAPSSARGSATPAVRPLWLTEGLPDYVARVVAGETGITEEGPFGTPTLGGVDAICADRARTADGAAMLAFVGAPGRPDVLYTTDRQRFAPTFYACAFSFTKYLAGRVGLDALVGLFALTPAEMVSQLDRVAGAPLADLRAQWLRQLAVP
jgi:hypothetical protein